jgi:hypothetical protein
MGRAGEEGALHVCVWKHGVQHFGIKVEAESVGKRSSWIRC